MLPPLSMRWRPGDEVRCGYEAMRRGEQGWGDVQADLRRASVGLSHVKEKGNVRPDGFLRVA